MRQSYIVTYDICDQRRLRYVYKKMLGYGDHIQYSVFYCELNNMKLAKMKSELRCLINNNEDQILVINLGPANGRGQKCVENMGIKYAVSTDRVVII
ncbi:MAG: CRISPR-associated endonuclease Cas2 [Deltaproteobacteria bacterium]|nr:CRISPR-associated endonuclease Cas2 [Deltaproteobacteria bacterium]